jgi:hypothetical protein
MINYYEVLGVTSDATRKELTRAYRKLAKQVHPDALTGASEEERVAAGDRMGEINLAWAVLSDPHHRAVHDHRLRNTRAAPTPDEAKSQEINRLVDLLIKHGIAPRRQIGYALHHFGPPPMVRGGPQPTWTPFDIRSLVAFEASSLDVLRAIPPGLVRNLYADDQPIGDEDMTAVEGLGSLQLLEVSRTAVTDAGLKRLVSLGLTDLTLWRTGVTDKGMESVGSMTGLVNLNIGRTAVTDAGIAQLGSLRELRLLNVRSTEATAAGLSQLAALPALELLAVPRLRFTEKRRLAHALPGVTLT